MSQAVHHISISKRNILLLLLSPAFSRRSFSKTERNGTRYDSSGGGEKRGRLVSSRVGAGERRSLPDLTQASLFFRCASNSLDKLSTTAVIQTTSDYYRYFLRVSSGTTYYKRGIDTKTKLMHHLSYT